LFTSYAVNKCRLYFIHIVEKSDSNQLYYFRTNEKYKGLIHFIFIDRSNNTVTAQSISAPTRGQASSLGGSISSSRSPNLQASGSSFVEADINEDYIVSLIHNAVWECVCFGQQALCQGCYCAVAKSDPFILCYSMYVVEKNKEKVTFDHPRNGLNKALAFYATPYNSIESTPAPVTLSLKKGKPPPSSSTTQNAYTPSAASYPTTFFPCDPHFYRLLRRSLQQQPHKQPGGLCEVYGVYANTISSSAAVEINMRIIAKQKK
jgi:hypothetical protein